MSGQKQEKSFTNLLIELRIGYACTLLSKRKLNSAQISVECGFSNITTFYEHFKAITSLTPLAYLRADARKINLIKDAYVSQRVWSYTFLLPILPP